MAVSCCQSKARISPGQLSDRLNSHTQPRCLLDLSRTKEASIKFALLCSTTHMARVEVPKGLWQKRSDQRNAILVARSCPGSVTQRSMRAREPMQSVEGYLLNNFFLAVASSLSLSSPTSGYSKSRSDRVSITAAATTTRVNHLLSAGTTYHGAAFVAVS
jgi:hypothetical protein